MKTLILIIELVLTIATFFIVLNMTYYSVASYNQAKDTAYGTIDQLQNEVTASYGDTPTGYMPVQSNEILSNILNFRI